MRYITSTNSVTNTRVLMIYTGGTIGMQKNKNGAYAPVENAFAKKIRDTSEFHDQQLHKSLVESGDCTDDDLVMNYEKSLTKSMNIIYKIEEFNPLLDSSNMCDKDWIIIAKHIKKCYKVYDAFIVLNGTDTLAYTASALSFMLEGLRKTVVVTGSQIPIFEPRNDAKDNIMGSLVLAATSEIPEVCVYFGYTLMRGNRTCKHSSNMLNAFISPNYPPLGVAGIDYKVNMEHVFNDTSIHLKLHEQLNPHVALVRIFPTITANMLQGFLGENSKLEGIVFESYGCGNVPSNNEEFMKLVRKAVERGVVIVNVTQCAQGSVSAAYETGRALEEIGILPGYDMTSSAALTKLAVVLGMKDKTLDEKKHLMITNIRGEFTIPLISSNP